MLPVITGPMQPVRTGSQITLNCSAESRPPSNYTWFLNDSMLTSGWMYVIDNATSDNSGKYSCVATNDVTKQNSSAIKDLMVIGEWKHSYVSPSLLLLDSCNICIEWAVSK